MGLLYVVAYDIEDDRRRGRVARVLEGYGRRVQYSVFECDISGQHFEQMGARLRKILEPGDGLRAYRVVQPDRNVVIFGGVPVARNPRLIII